MSLSACAYFSSETGGKLPQLLKTGFVMQFQVLGLEAMVYEPLLYT